MITRAIPLKRRGVVREHKMYKIYLPKEFEEVWEFLHRESRKVDVIIFIPDETERDRPEILKLVDKIIMRGRHITRERNRFKIYLSSTYNDIWEYLNKHSIKVDVILILR